MIASQIAEGEKLLAATPRDRDALKQQQQEYEIWNSYNREVLKRIFSSTEVLDEYDAFFGSSYRMNPDLADLVRYHKRDIETRLTRLRAVDKKLPLIPEAPIVAGSTRRPPEKFESNEVFIVHGHNNEVKETVARFVEHLGLTVTILHEQANLGRTIIEKFEDHASVGFAVILLTGDDVGAARSEWETKKDPALRPRARQNVVLEHGYFIAKLGRARVSALRQEGVEVPSDLSGVLYTPIDAEGAWKFRLAKEMKEAGLPIDLNRLA